MNHVTTTNLNDIPRILQTFGVCVIPNVLNSELCYDTINGMIGSFEELTRNTTVPFIYNDPSTWHTLSQLLPHHNMLYQHFGLGQRPYIWRNIRTNPEIIKCFKSIWGTDKLICSMDGIAFHLPSEISHLPHYATDKNEWFHFDQKLINSQFQTIQGLVNALDTNEGDACLTVLARSHLFFEQYAQLKIGEFCNITPNVTEDAIKKQFDSDFVKIDNKQFFINQGCFELQVTCPAGSLVLWDSRCAHYGKQPDQIRRNPNVRCVVYVCMVPAEFFEQNKFTRKTMVKKSLDIVATNRQTNHYPQKRKMFSEFPGNRFVRFIDPGLTKFLPTDIMQIPGAYQILTGEY